ncbi:MAG: T9SS type A sorting domain-containing protein, partial [Bacteroidales bacterium]
GNGTAGYAMLRKISSNGTTYAPFKTINPDFGRFAQIDFAVNQYTGLEEKHVENAMVKLYPNPAQISIFIEINGAEKEQVIAELYDMFGRLLKVQPFFGSNKLEMAVNELSQGIYIVVCREGGKVIGRNKFVVSGK